MVSALQGSFRDQGGAAGGSNGDYSVSATVTHPRYSDLYKNKGEKTLEKSQENRRLERLERQKE